MTLFSVALKMVDLTHFALSTFFFTDFIFNNIILTSSRGEIKSSNTKIFDIESEMGATVFSNPHFSQWVSLESNMLSS